MLIQMNDIVPSTFPERFIISSYCNFYDTEFYILPIVEDFFEGTVAVKYCEERGEVFLNHQTMLL